MNPSPTEEMGLTARSVVASLKSTPVVLAILIFNIIYLIGSFYTLHHVMETTLKLCQLPGMKLQSDESRPAS